MWLPPHGPRWLLKDYHYICIPVRGGVCTPNLEPKLEAGCHWPELSCGTTYLQGSLENVVLSCVALGPARNASLWKKGEGILQATSTLCPDGHQGVYASPKENNLGLLSNFLALNFTLSTWYLRSNPALPAHHPWETFQTAPTHFASLISPTSQPTLLTGPRDSF